MSEQTQEPTATLTLTVNELNLVFGALQELPFKVVDPFIRKIQGQLFAQAKAAEEAATGVEGSGE